MRSHLTRRDVLAGASVVAAAPASAIAEAAAGHERTAAMTTNTLAPATIGAGGIAEPTLADHDLITAYRRWRRTEAECRDAADAYDQALDSADRAMPSEDARRHLPRTREEIDKMRSDGVLSPARLAQLDELEKLQERVFEAHGVPDLGRRHVAAERRERAARIAFLATPALSAIGVALKLQCAYERGDATYEDGRTEPPEESPLKALQSDVSRIFGLHGFTREG